MKLCEGSLTLQLESLLCGHLGAVERHVAGGLPELGHDLVVGEAEQHGHGEALGRRGQRGQDLVRVLQTRALHQLSWWRTPSTEFS